MFTGIIEELGTVAEAGRHLRVKCDVVLAGLAPGASIAVNGVCLTAARIGPGEFTADLAPETLRRSNLGDLQPGARVNLERPATPTTFLSGHIVQGHVDATGEVAAIEQLGGGHWWLKVRIPRELDRYMVEKGSVALDGVSLTIAAVEGDLIGITVIPHTFAHTTLGQLKPGARVNIEADVLAKHVEKLLARR